MKTYKTREQTNKDYISFLNFLLLRSNIPFTINTYDNEMKERKITRTFIFLMHKCGLIDTNNGVFTFNKKFNNAETALLLIKRFASTYNTEKRQLNKIKKLQQLQISDNIQADKISEIHSMLKLLITKLGLS